MGEVMPSAGGVTWEGGNTSSWTHPQPREIAHDSLADPQNATFDKQVPDSSSTTIRYLASRFLIALAIWAGTHAAQTLRRDASSPRPRFPSRTAPRLRCWLLLSFGFFLIGLFSLGQACLSSVLSFVHAATRFLCLSPKSPPSSSSQGAGYRLTIFRRDSQEVLDVAMEFWEREVERALVGPHGADASALVLVPLTVNWFFLAWPRAIFRSEAGYESFLREALDFWEDRLPLMLRGPQRPETKSG